MSRRVVLHGHLWDQKEFWLTKLNQFTLPGEDARDESVALRRVRRAEMVRGFSESAEYRQRFGGAPSGDQKATKLTAAAPPAIPERHLP